MVAFGSRSGMADERAVHLGVRAVACFLQFPALVPGHNEPVKRSIAGRRVIHLIQEVGLLAKRTVQPKRGRRPGSRLANRIGGLDEKLDHRVGRLRRYHRAENAVAGESIAGPAIVIHRRDGKGLGLLAAGDPVVQAGSEASAGFIDQPRTHQYQVAGSRHDRKVRHVYNHRWQVGAARRIGLSGRTEFDFTCRPVLAKLVRQSGVN